MMAIILIPKLISFSLNPKIKAARPKIIAIGPRIMAEVIKKPIPPTTRPVIAQIITNSTFVNCFL